MKTSSITFIGAGNLAWHLAPAFDNTDYFVREVFSRNKKNAFDLVAKLYESEIADSLDLSQSQSEIFILAVPDDSIEEIVEKLVIPEQRVLVHTSGSKPLSILENSFTPNIGVIYPLQTFSKGKMVDMIDVPFFIEGENEKTEGILLELAKAITSEARILSSDKRRLLHLSAVFASNFTNHMLTIANEIMDRNKMDFEWLKPLIAETLNKSLEIGPYKAQTGPARRGDLEILDSHMTVLQKDAELQEIYRLISQHILDKYQT
jgi:predicted short-subunit dehydrogenase-like oxidoreductase (DUF2520 family)